MPQKSGKKLVIAGARQMGEVALDYFTNDSEYEVVAFTVDRAYLDGAELFGLPVVPLDEVARRFPPASHDLFVAVFSSGLNRVREDLCRRTRALGYHLVSYVSSRADVARTATLGPNCMVFPMVHVMPRATVGEGVILGPGAVVAHHARIEPYAFLTIAASVGGGAVVGARSFLGIGCIVTDEVKVGPDCLIGAGTCIRSDVEAGKVLAAPKPTEKPFTALEYFGGTAARKP
ncbi:MAG: hypothetical protein QOJ26_677 [Thermoplasmata archaeon]|nr:hypothetical protein [Thermoplasmata archaeon]MEA3165811.1 hypothetical protein [Thermoplasmata archaeon]